MTVAAWDNDEFLKCGLGAFSVNMEEHEQKTGPKPTKVFKFHCYLENWELQAIRQKDIVNKNKILRKYGGMSWKDPDSDPITYALVTACTNELEWQRGGKRYRGYHVVAKGLNYDPLNIRDEDYNYWEIGHIIFGCIYEYYNDNPDPSVHIVTKPESFDSAGEWNFDEDGIEIARQVALEKEQMKLQEETVNTDGEGGKKPAAKRTKQGSSKRDAGKSKKNKRAKV
jgi:hypothetical protein